MPARAGGFNSESSAPGDLARFFAKVQATHGRKAKVVNLEVANEYDGRRLDNFLLAHFAGVPRSLIYKIIRDGQVRVSGKRAKPKHRLRGGERIRIPPLSHKPRIPPPTPTSLTWLRARILSIDDNFLVINKPSGIPVHGGGRMGYGLVDLLEAAGIAKKLRIVHRLDRDTSGCLLIARNYRAAAALHKQFATHKVAKNYLALALGGAHAEFEAREPLAVTKSKSLAKVRVSDAGKQARTVFIPLERAGEAYTLFKVATHSGRMHQIRVHAAHHGLPIAGDSRYGDFAHNRRLKSYGLRRTFLHAWTIAFDYEGKNYKFEAPLPEELNKVWVKLRASRRVKR